MRRNYYQGGAEQRYHLSAGVLAVDKDGLLGVHHFPRNGEDSERYEFVHETVELGETLEAAALRGLREEFGAEARIFGYLGCLLTTFHSHGAAIEKATEYLVAQVESWNESRRKTDDNSVGSRIEWFTSDRLLSLMDAQADRDATSGLDESAILRRYIDRLHPK